MIEILDHILEDGVRHIRVSSLYFEIIKYELNINKGVNILYGDKLTIILFPHTEESFEKYLIHHYIKVKNQLTELRKDRD